MRASLKKISKTTEASTARKTVEHHLNNGCKATHIKTDRLNQYTAQPSKTTAPKAAYSLPHVFYVKATSPTQPNPLKGFLVKPLLPFILCTGPDGSNSTFISNLTTIDDVNRSVKDL